MSAETPASEISHTPTLVMEQRVQPSAALQEAIAQLIALDPDFGTIEQPEQPFTVRQWEPTFAALVRVITGQQLSTKAAQAIYNRLTDAIELTPTNLLATSVDQLQQAGLSRNKIKTCQGLAAAIVAGELQLDALKFQSDAEVIATLTQFKGVGPWTAEIFLLFCLQRLDIFPAADLALRVGYQRLKGLAERPSTEQLIQLCEPLRPWRSAAAHLLWYYYGISALG
ncbi:MAG: DNA-3-methyladenine glycosylase 2 family protein [Cyanobacteria bacterium P01_H01_bin.121]